MGAPVAPDNLYMSHHRSEINRSTAPLGLPAQFRIHVLAEREYTVAGEAAQLAGNRLLARLSEAVPRNAGVKIECEDSFLLAEVVTCWSAEGVVFGVMELRHQLTGLAELAALHQEYTDAPRQRPAELARPRA